MGKDNPIKIAVLSDLHFCKAPARQMKSHSWLDYKEDGAPVSPLWSHLESLIKNESLQADIIICPGDITTQACHSSLQLAWLHLNKLKSSLNSPVLAVATGNHDVQSRPVVKGVERPSELDSYTDLTENLKLLDPPYPLISDSITSSLKNHENRVKYFGANFTSIDIQRPRAPLRPKAARLG